MADQLREQMPCCAHRVVLYHNNENSGRVTREWWACQDCNTEFVCAALSAPPEQPPEGMTAEKWQEHLDYYAGLTREQLIAELHYLGEAYVELPKLIRKEVMQTEPEWKSGTPVTPPGVEQAGSGQECAASYTLLVLRNRYADRWHETERKQVEMALSHPCRPALTREDAEKLARQALSVRSLTSAQVEDVVPSLADILQRVAGERTHRVPCADPECSLCHFQLTDEDRAAIEGEKK